MTAVTAPGSGAARPSARRSIPLAPAEGWLTLILAGLLAGVVAWSIDDGAWILGRGKLTDFLLPVSLAGVLVAFAGAKAGWSRWTTHLVGAALAAIVVPLIAGALLRPDTLALPELYRTSARVAATVWTDFVVLHKLTTLEFGHYMIVFGIVAWGTGQFAGYAVFGHRRPFDAALVLGLILLMSMVLNRNDQLALLVVFSVATLLLMNRTHAFEERSKWQRSRIGDPSATRTAYQRGGALFVALAVLGAVMLTASARSAPLQGAFADLPQRLADMSQAFQRFLPTGGSNRSVGTVAFGSTLQINIQWGTQPGAAFSVVVPAGEPEQFYWRAVAYSRFDLNSWAFGNVRSTSRAPGTVLLKDLAEDPQPLPGRRLVTFTVQPDTYRGDVVMAPQMILSVSRASSVNVIGASGYFASVAASGVGPYQVAALVPVRGDDQPGALTKNRLRAAGTDYPLEIRALYLETPTGALGPAAKALLERIRGEAAGANPYDTAALMVDFFRNEANFTYDTDLRNLPCDGLSTVECFSVSRRGFCQWYATTMTIFLRELGIPARFVEGFLPGVRSDGVETVMNSSAHAWVEVWFPGYGWVEFDPTGGGVARDVPLPSGQPVAPATLGPGESVAPIDEDGGGDAPDLTDTGGFFLGPDGGSGPFILLALLLGLTLAGFAAWASLRGPLGDLSPEQTWGAIARLAARLGLGPRPAQTVYEYAGVLGDAMPAVRPELETVARARVEVAYGRRTLGTDRLQAVREAHRRLRLSLLRLAIRRGVRRPRL